MRTRLSTLTGGMVNIPDALPDSPDLATQIADLRVQLATAEAQRDAEKRRADEAEERCRTANIATQAANDRATQLAGQMGAAPVVQIPPSDPVAYDVIVTKRDGDDRLERLKIIPAGAI